MVAVEVGEVVEAVKAVERSPWPKVFAVHAALAVVEYAVEEAAAEEAAAEEAAVHAYDDGALLALEPELVLALALGYVVLALVHDVPFHWPFAVSHVHLPTLAPIAAESFPTQGCHRDLCQYVFSSQAEVPSKISPLEKAAAVYLQDVLLLESPQSGGFVWGLFDFVSGSSIQEADSNKKT